MKSAAAFLALALFAACSTDGANFGMRTYRTGKPFVEAFPDPAELVTTLDVETVRGRLNETPMPETAEHHDQLRGLIAKAESLTTDHLLLVAEAVALPGRLSYESNVGISVVSINGRTFVSSRGKGEFAPVVDELLLAGANKVSDPGPHNLGRILGATQFPRGLLQLAGELAEWEDGSVGHLDQVLRGMPMDGLRNEYCIDYLLPAGRLSEARAEAAFRHLSFDSERMRLLGADYGRRSSVPFDTFLQHAKAMSFDSGRFEVVKIGGPKLGSINGTQALALVRLASFDDGRAKILEAVDVRLDSFDQALALVKTASFDSGRDRLLRTLLNGSPPEPRGRDLVALVRTASFDSQRGKYLAAVVPTIRSAIDPVTATDLMRTFSFDSGRNAALRVLAPKLRETPAEARQGILATFSMKSGREEARRILGW